MNGRIHCGSIIIISLVLHCGSTTSTSDIQLQQLCQEDSINVSTNSFLVTMKLYYIIIWSSWSPTIYPYAISLENEVKIC